MTKAESLEQSGDAIDPGLVRAGAAAAARRRELDISQRSLAADGIINAGALIAFEKGRSWPRDRTRARLEEVLRWPPGTIARLRRGETGRPAEPPTDPRAPSSNDDAALIAQALVTAIGTVRPVIAALPPPAAPDFPARVGEALDSVRQLEAVAARAARMGRVTPALIKALGTVRGLYDDLMMRAAAAPGATLGQRLYAARRAANLTVQEIAQAAGISDAVVARAEADQPVSAECAEALAALLADLS